MGALLCKLGLHKRGPWREIELFHEGEYPWEPWTHLCRAYSRGHCQRCGLPPRRRRNVCRHPIIPGPRQTEYGYDWRGVPEADRKLFRNIIKS